MGFIHLHNHTDYSLMESIASIPKYIKKACQCGMTSLAITDHGNMSGAISFYEACHHAGINPIIGTEFNIAAKARHKKDNNNYHLILLAMNDAGYHNLMKLNSIAYTEGFYKEPRITKETLSQYSNDLICLSAGLEEEISQLLLSDDYEKAKDSARWYKNLFGDRYYLELQDHGLMEEKKANQILAQLSHELDIPLVCTNNIHYIEKSDWNAHDTFLCIKTKSKKSDKNRRRYKKGQYYFRTPEEMAKLFAWCPEAVENTEKIAERCKLEIKFPGPVFPEFTIPHEFKDKAEYLTYLANEGLKKRYPVISKEIQQRLDYELGIIIHSGYADYFLVVWDYVRWAKTHDILVGPGRGKSAGSLVAYSLAITDVDPIKYDLLFEGFINPERVSLPDIDVDFCPDELPQVINYVTELYGKQNVGRIIHFEKMKLETIIKDVANVLDIPKNEIRKICSYISYYPNLKGAFARNPKLKLIKAKGGVYKELFDTAQRLEGLIGHSFLHPSGVVIGREPLDSYVPLYANPKTGDVSTQYDMFEIGDCGLVKMDFVGFKELTLIKHSVELIHKKKPDFDITKIDEHDKKTFDMLANGDSEGVFQFESSGMSNVLQKAKVSTIEELIAINALYRPGPIMLIDKYIGSKNGVIPVKYPDPSLEAVLKNTYGVIVYQEQVMRIAQIIAGYTLGQADILRRDMGKRKREKLAEQLLRFKAGAVKNGFTEEHAEEIFHILEQFAGYSFNKSHAVAYSIIAYQTAFLKANYPDEFYAAMRDVDKINCEISTIL